MHIKPLASSSAQTFPSLQLSPPLPETKLPEALGAAGRGWGGGGTPEESSELLRSKEGKARKRRDLQALPPGVCVQGSSTHQALVANRGLGMEGGSLMSNWLPLSGPGASLGREKKVVQI